MTIKEGFLDSSTAPLALDMRTAKSTPFTLAENYRARFSRRMDFLQSFDTSRGLDGSGVSKRLLEWHAFAKSAEKMIRSPKMAEVFHLDESERKRYGGSSVGDACIIARNMVAAEADAHYILVNHGGWDHHFNIYGKGDALRGENSRERRGIYQVCAELDPAFATLLADLKKMNSKDGSSLLDKTLIVAVGEFGRTPGELGDVKGRDHWPTVRAGVFAGAGVKGGRVIGATDEIGGTVTEFEWHKKRPIYPEDVSATIYSVLGIDWTKKLSDTPSGRNFQYIEPMSGTNVINSTEVTELFD